MGILGSMVYLFFAKVLPKVWPLRIAGPDGNRSMSKFQSDQLVSLVVTINGEYIWSNPSRESSKKMAVKEADHTRC